MTRKQAAEVLIEVGGTAVTSHLLRLLANEQVNEDVRGTIAQALGTLGERSVIPDLLRLLADKQVDELVHGSIGAAVPLRAAGCGADFLSRV